MSVSAAEITCQLTGVRREREWMQVGAIDRRKRRRAPDAGVDAFTPE